MSKKFPIDEFDSAVGNGGRHRAERTAKDRVLEWVSVFSVAFLVSVGGYFALQLIQNSSVFEGSLTGGNPAPTASSQALPEITVLDGGGKDLAAGAGQLLKDAGFNVIGASVLVDSDKKPIATAKTVVIITDEILSSDAAKVAGELSTKTGTPEILVSSQFPGPITLVLGADYVAPQK